MGWEITLSLAALAMLVYAVSGWRRSLPSQPGKVRMVPWGFIQAVAVASLFMLVVHAANLAGFQTGQSTASPK